MGEEEEDSKSPVMLVYFWFRFALDVSYSVICITPWL